LVKKKCSVEGCDKQAVTEIGYNRAKLLEDKGFKLKVYHAHPPRKPGVVYLCETHYKLWKKLTKKETMIEKMLQKGM